DDDDDAPDMSIKAAIFMLLISTGLVAICADFMSDAIEPMVEHSSISQAFIGLIILPIVGNAAEHVTAVTVAMKNKVDRAIGGNELRCQNGETVAHAVHMMKRMWVM